MRATRAIAPLLLLAALPAWGAPFAYVTGCLLDSMGGIDTCSQITVVDTATETVVGSIPIGIPGDQFPSWVVAANASGTRAYVSSGFGNGLSVIDTAGNSQITVVDTFGDGGVFQGVAVSADGTRAWVADEFDGLAAVDATTNTLLTVGNLNEILHDVAVHPDGQHLYVTTDTGGVLVLDAATLALQTTIPASSPWGVKVSPDGARAYVGVQGGVLVVDASTNAVVTTVPISGGTGGYAVAVHPDGSRVYVTGEGAAVVSVIDTATNTELTSVAVPNRRDGIAVHPDGTRVYVTNSDSASMSIIDTATNLVIGTVPVGAGPTSVAVIPTTVEADLKCYKGRTARGTTRFTPRTVPVLDAFELKNMSVTKPTDLCTPIGGSGNLPSHRVCYAAANTKGQPVLFSTETVTTTDRFGTHPLVVTGAGSGTLCLPGTGLPLDAMKCRKARAKPHTFTPQQISLTDAFETKTTDLLKPVLYCTSASVDGGAQSTPAARRTCYKIRDTKGQLPFAKRDAGQPDAFGALTLTLTKADLLCVPTSP